MKPKPAPAKSKTALATSTAKNSTAKNSTVKNPSTSAPATGTDGSDDIECNGSYGAVTLNGNVVVPDDANCVLNGTFVEGAVVVKSRACLSASEVTVRNGVQGQGAAKVVIEDSEFGNSVSLCKGGEVRIKGSNVNGSIQVDENTGAVALSSNRVLGNVQASKNTGGVDVRSNTIGNDLHCQDNEPPTTGSGNIAKQKQGQSEGL